MQIAKVSQFWEGLLTGHVGRFVGKNETFEGMELEGVGEKKWETEYQVLLAEGDMHVVLLGVVEPILV